MGTFWLLVLFQDGRSRKRVCWNCALPIELVGTPILGPGKLFDLGFTSSGGKHCLLCVLFARLDHFPVFWGRVLIIPAGTFFFARRGIKGSPGVKVPRRLLGAFFRVAGSSLAPQGFAVRVRLPGWGDFCSPIFPGCLIFNAPRGGCINLKGPVIKAMIPVL